MVATGNVMGFTSILVAVHGPGMDSVDAVPGNVSSCPRGYIKYGVRLRGSNASHRVRTSRYLAGACSLRVGMAMDWQC